MLPRRIGFSIAEIVVAVAIMAILGGIIIPTMSGYLDRKRVVESAAILDSLEISIRRFRTAVTDYPGRLSHLTKKISTTDYTSCNAPLVSRVAYTGSVGWMTAGPFWDGSLASSTNAINIPIGPVRDSMYRTGNNTTAGNLFITLPDVSIEDARELNRLEDGELDVDLADGSNNRGTIQYPIPTASTTVSYVIPIAPGC